jgi:hypothetical protein
LFPGNLFHILSHIFSTRFFFPTSLMLFLFYSFGSMIRHHWSHLSLSLSLSVTQKTKLGTKPFRFWNLQITHTHTQQDSSDRVMSSLQSPTAGFEPATAGSDRPQTYNLDRTPNMIGIGHSWCYYILVWMCYVSFFSIWPSTEETLLPTIILAFISFQPDLCLLTRRLDIQTFIHIHMSAHLF